MSACVARRRSKVQSDEDSSEETDAPVDKGYDKLDKPANVSDERASSPPPPVVPKTVVSPEITEAIIHIVEPAYVRDVKEALRGRFSWKKISEVCETTSKLLSGFSSIFAFAAGAYDYPFLSFTSGCIGTVALVVMLFGTYAAKESNERTQQLNMTLHHVGIRGMPMIAVVPAAEENPG